MWYDGEFQLVRKIGIHDGYRPPAIWHVEDKNFSTYDNIFEDNQCSVPLIGNDENVKKMVKKYK